MLLISLLSSLIPPCASPFKELKYVDSLNCINLGIRNIPCFVFPSHSNHLSGPKLKQLHIRWFLHPRISIATLTEEDFIPLGISTIQRKKILHHHSNGLVPTCHVCTVSWEWACGVSSLTEQKPNILNSSYN